MCSETTGISWHKLACLSRDVHLPDARCVADRLDTIALFLLRPRLWSLSSIIAETGCRGLPIETRQGCPRTGRSPTNSQLNVERETRRWKAARHRLRFAFFLSLSPFQRSLQGTALKIDDATCQLRNESFVFSQSSTVEYLFFPLINSRTEEFGSRDRRLSPWSAHRKLIPSPVEVI